MNNSDLYKTLVRVFGSLCLICCLSHYSVGQITLINLNHLANNKVSPVIVYTTSSLDRLNFDSEENFTLTTSVMKIEKFNPNDLPMFCKMEHQMWSSSKMNVRIRLGSLEYVDKLEGKY